MFGAGALGRAAGAGYDFRAEMVRDLDRGHTDAAGTRVNEHAFTFSQSSDIVQRMPGRHENNRDRRGFLKRKAVRNTADVAAARNRLRRQAEHGQAKNPVARFTCVTPALQPP